MSDRTRLRLGSLIALIAVPIVVVGSLMLAVLSVIWRPQTPGVDAEIRACDQAVATLMATHDFVDLQRAQFIIRRLDCSISKRLPFVVAPATVG